MSRFTLPMLRFTSRDALYRDLDEMMKLRQKCKHFRILIIGRANAGKTTILQKICNTNEEASIQDAKGNMIPMSTITPSNMRGMHDIEKSLVFPSNQGFVFHDSRGIEAGGKQELDIVQNFIAKRAKSHNLEDRIHVIWYCIPVDNDRIFTAAEKSFFDSLSRHGAPVIAIFTKFDHRDIESFMSLQEEGLEDTEAKAKAPNHAKEVFEKEFLPEIYNLSYPPQRHVYLRDMQEPDSSVSELAERTAEVLENGVLRLMFVSTQRSSITLCIKYAIEQVVVKWFIDYRKKSHKGPAALMSRADVYQFACHVLVWFPYDLVSVAYHNISSLFIDVPDKNAKGEVGVSLSYYRAYREVDQFRSHLGTRGGELNLPVRLVRECMTTPDASADIRDPALGLANQAANLQDEFEVLAGAHPATNRVLRLGIALCVSAEHSYSFPSRHRLRVAIEEYQKSRAKLVDDAVEQIVKDKTSDIQLSDTLIKLVAQSSLLSKE
ncbi:hypothetical protein EYR38_001543 [Pleurotus pulmonarius]|nr:hypothetical protein EYR38_001543 [Pleurotus pulmonarius]